MASIADITVYDGAATPVAHVLKAVSTRAINGGIEARYREANASLPTEAQVSAVLTEKLLNSGVKQVELDVSVPVMESVSGQNAAGYTAAPKVAYVDRFKLTNFQHPRSTINGRRLARQMILNMSGNISTSVTAATSGAMPDAFDSQIMPS